MRKWVCVVCGFIYDEAEGVPEDGVAPGTRIEALPAGHWKCPERRSSRDVFRLRAH